VRVALRVALRDGGRTLGTATVAVPAGSAVATATLRDVGEIRLWDIDAPNLYDVVVTLLVDGAAVHRRSVRIGFREARFDVDGFFLNGRRVKLFGLNRHQIYPYTGMAMPARVQRRDAEILARDLGCNIVRCAHYPQSAEFLDACDELGLLVWQEPPGWQYVGDAAWQELVVRDVHDMIMRDRNRPSIVIWGVRVNESANFPDLYTRTKAVAYELDGSRPTSGSMTRHSTQDWVQDVFAFDDYTHDDQNAQLLPPLAGVPYLVAEAVGALDGPHYYRWIDSQDILAKQAVLHAQVHDIARSNDRYAGLIGWLAFDYGSLNGWTYQNQKTPGVGDIFRVLKPGAAFYRSQVSPRRRVVLEPAFCWDPDAGAPGVGAVICTNCDRLEIYGDDKHLTTTRPDRGRFAHLDHPPHFADLTVSPATVSELRIEGYLGSELRATRRMSAGPVRLSLELDDATLQADGVDATRVLVRVVDNYGNRRPYAEGAVRWDVTGPGILVGDNPFELAESPGVAAVWLRTEPGAAGEVVVCASHPTLGTASGRLTVRP
jgi:beta-galactosidase